MIKPSSIIIGIFLVCLCASCNSSDDTKQELTSSCIRGCVLETSDAQICDTDCRCATKKLSAKYSKKDFANLVQSIKQESVDDISELKNSLNSCRNLRE